MAPYKTTVSNEKMTRSYSEVLLHEELHYGRLIPILKPIHSTVKINPRKYAALERNYLNLKELYAHLSSNWLVTCVKETRGKTTDEEILLNLTNKLIECQSSDGFTKEHLIPNEDVASFRQVSFKYLKMSNTVFHKCVTNEKGTALLTFTYATNEKQNVVKMNIFYVDFKTLLVRKYDHLFVLRCISEFKFKIALAEDVLYIIWPCEGYISTLIMDKCLSNFKKTDIGFDISEIPYVISTHARNAVITIQDSDFTDSVFSVNDASLRLSTFFSPTTMMYNTKNIIKDLSNLVYLEHPADAYLIKMAQKSVWVVTEWLLPEMTLDKIIICRGTHEGRISQLLKILECREIFQQYKTYFNTPNENQYCIEVCKTTWKLFIWSSKNHVLIISLESFEIVGLIEMNCKKFADFKTERYNYELKISPCGEMIYVLVKKSRAVVHVEAFRIPLSLL